MSDLEVGNVAFVGPFAAEWRVVIENRMIPRLTAVVSNDSSRVVLILDGRFAAEGTPEEVAKWTPMVANALAIGEGYPWYGADSKARPFAPVAQGVTINPKPELRLIPRDDSSEGP